VALRLPEVAADPPEPPAPTITDIVPETLTDVA
jgi:hypothetical protein